ncbi:hypothetical protein FQN60_006231 [Etheostoma spectabile]|uniref:Uncharacterized protein n=1 Tax=Etheostoma spectabile TaxID=54343 RepID=A0A5J5CQB6_9PERO|nr:hypothetical protein FQN60_006231 [Etheostoma spectabile]
MRSSLRPACLFFFPVRVSDCLQGWLCVCVWEGGGTRLLMCKHTGGMLSFGWAMMQVCSNIHWMKSSLITEGRKKRRKKTTNYLLFEKK